MIYFAWVDPTETTFQPEHEREDQKVLSLELSQAEGEFASLKVDVKNPRIGLLAPGRKQWAWVSHKAADATTGEATPLFFGRLVAIPADLADEVITLEFIARPVDWDAQRAALAADLRVLPYYDPVWFRPEARDDPDSVLEGYTKLWHSDRVTHVVTTSDVLVGEDGVMDIGGGFFRDSLGVKYDKIPGRRVRVKATAQWTQQAFGSINLTQSIADAFRTIGGYSGNPYLIASYTGQGLMEDWPKKGDRIGAGWTVGEGTVATRVDGKVNDGDDQVVVQTDNGRIVSFPVWTIKGEFVADYLASRARAETVEFTLEADVQAVLTDPGDDEVLSLELTSEELDEPIDEDDAVPIGDLRRRSYFQSDRGWRSIEYLIARARALLVSRSRALIVTVELPWSLGLEVSLRKSALVEDARLPCGQAAGKIVGYSLSVDGDRGEHTCQIAIACSLGQGNTVTDGDGDPLYVEDDYVEDGYQARENRVVMPIAGIVTYTPPEGIAIEDDGLDFTDLRASDVILPIDDTDPDEPGVDVIFGPGPQSAVIGLGGGDMAAVIEALNVAYTAIRINLKPLTRGPYEQTYVVSVSDLMIPKTVDLECDGDTSTSTTE